MEIPTTPFAFAVFAAITLLGVLWGMVRGQNSEQGKRIANLEAQNVEQQKYITRLTTQMEAREKAHEEHRESTASAIQSLRTDMRSDLRELSGKIDRLLGLPPRRETPSPGRYGSGSSGSER